MTQQLPKETLVRLSWITELRRQGHRKCEGVYEDESAGVRYVCALGLLHEVAGFEPGSVAHLSGDPDSRGEALAGLSYAQGEMVVFMNDGDGDNRRKYTFSEIADVIESWFPPTPRE